MTDDCLLITERCQVSSGEKAYEFVEKVLIINLDILPEVVISYRLQFAAERRNPT